MNTFSDILKRRAADIEPPKPLPAGVYSAVVDGPFRQVESKEKKTPGIEFTFRLIEPVSVNDMDMLVKAGGCAGKTMRHTFYISENNEWRLQQFLVNHLGIEAEDKTIEQCLIEASGRSVAVVIKNEVRTAANGEARLGYNIEGTAKL
jgi:hypothetical protein